MSQDGYGPVVDTFLCVSFVFMCLVLSSKHTFKLLMLTRQLSTLVQKQDLHPVAAELRLYLLPHIV